MRLLFALLLGGAMAAAHGLHKYVPKKLKIK